MEGVGTTSTFPQKLVLVVKDINDVKEKGLVAEETINNPKKKMKVKSNFLIICLVAFFWFITIISRVRI